MRPLRFLLLAATLCLVAPPVGFAAGTNETASQAVEDADWTAARSAIAQKKYDTAEPLLRRVVTKDPGNADAWNYLGYIHARTDRNVEALDYYGKALALQPRHRGANEYLGELYLKMGDLTKAEERLEVLDGACFFGCAEYDMLKKAVDQFKQTGKYAPQKG